MLWMKEDKYLSLKEDSQLDAEQKKYEKAQDDYLKAVKDNSLDKDDLKQKRDEAIKAMKTEVEMGS